MYLRTWLGAFCLSALFSASAVAATAEQGNQDQCAADLFGADSVCGVPGAWTAVGRMPAARIVIFDPVSNSFAYVACGRAPKDPRTISNQDYLDRRRLALSTQKIRLLILPYNPADGDLGLEVHHGEGVEFAEIAGIDFPESTPAATTPTPKGKTPQEEEEEKNTREGAEASTELANDAVSAVEGVAGRVQDLEEQIRPVAGGLPPVG